ncbi:diaminopimelate epimerase [Anaerotalea alkaliphila]|uniref:Diaminopimelate epimerase n=1 Tax=Anaerotalea alkaliphila TaxID=2662126 RepID=A0A7X5HW77_9FIRM|nr:diaminopimelate epimerase [Anaerotalea alkaliphila]NDL67753.1 diaminopimelate epimerase [Anaerotalea alkaliphila]
MKFTKMHGCGNDYVYVSGFQETIEDYPAMARKVSNRNFGVGSDGLVVILPGTAGDFRMRMFNPDGSEAEMCGNAIRCVGKYVYDKGMTREKVVRVDTLAGLKVLELTEEDGTIAKVRVDMGEPVLDPVKIPVASDAQPVLAEVVEASGRSFPFTCVSMGNPHAVTFVEDTDAFPVEEIGRQVEVDAKFPRKTNVEFVQVLDRETVKMRVWERGTGETLACGTGACATLVACVLNGKTERKATVRLLGGDLFIEWDEATNHVFMTGPATLVFEGELHV